ncbi:MAG: sigma-70 family RNA polymerase sigma factor [Verrucomicrobia bacterium]|nr:sigma-70 family RNA polymerase sigma factor [Verrucomicrobiota bacterium]
MTEPQQFEVFVKSYQNMVFSGAVRMLGNETEAEDIAQEVFLKAYERFDDLRTSATAGGWLKTVTRNLCLNHLTRYRARWKFFSEMVSEHEGEEKEIEWAAPQTHEQDLAAADRRRLLELVLQRLPPAQRIPLVLYHFEDMSYEAIAEKLNISLSKVKTDIHRGRETLRRKLRLGSTGEELAGLCGAEDPCPS